MVLKRNLLGWRLEEYWFDEAGYLSSTADIVAVRSHTPVRASHCSIPERTLLVPLSGGIEAILDAFDARAKTSIRHAAKTVTVELAASPEERELFYAAYRPFAAGRGLLIPDSREEAELDILLARDLEGNLLQAGAFLPAKAAGIYRYRYGVYVRKSQANAALMQAAILRAKELGFSHFDLGGITPEAKSGSADAGINFFKSQFGGIPTDSRLYLRGTRPAVRALLVLLRVSGLAARYHKLSALAVRMARR
jgi:lipid II:glycine glycyltransferase (peptidoglycan interpeptide bridge formation enzyme)